PADSVAQDIASGVVCAIKDGGRVECRGANDEGELGVGFAGTVDGGIPAAFESGVATLALGWFHACALLDDGSVRCWGDNEAGKVGTDAYSTARCGPSFCQLTPRPVQGLPPIAEIAAGFDTTCALAVDSSLWCWGRPLGGSPLGLLGRIPGPWED